MKTCKSCSKRTPGCHANCQEGIEQDLERKTRQERIKKERAKDNDYMAYKVQNENQKAKWP